MGKRAHGNQGIKERLRNTIQVKKKRGVKPDSHMRLGGNEGGA